MLHIFRDDEWRLDSERLRSDHPQEQLDWLAHVLLMGLHVDLCVPKHEFGRCRGQLP